MTCTLNIGRIFYDWWRLLDIGRGTADYQHDVGISYRSQYAMQPVKCKGPRRTALFSCPVYF